MTRLELSFALRTNPRVQALVTGPTTIEGVDPNISLLAPADTFWRQLRYQEFDVSEMSLSVLIRAIANGDTRWYGLPIFPDRRFFHASIVVRKDSDIRVPADLRGVRMGVPDYSQTGALWGRAVLEHDFGIAGPEMVWYQERTSELSHGGSSNFHPPADLTIHHIPPGDSQRAMFADGRLDASILFITYTTLIDRSSGALEEANVRPLFPDADAEKARAYAKWGWLPFNHCYVVRRELVERHPWLALNLYTAFLAAKERDRAAILESVRQHYEAGLVTPDERGRLSTDLFPYGIAANRDELSAITRFAYDQGLTPRLVDAGELFPPSLQEL